MRTPLGKIYLAGSLGVMLVLSGCSASGLRQLSAPGSGPDEFLILPNKPLTAPSNYSALPTPTPGGANLVDQNPQEDAIIALGGRPGALDNNSVPAVDGVLVAQASRYGVPANTRSTLAETDAKFRKREAILANVRLFKVDRYEQAYSQQKIDPFAQASRFIRNGIRIPSVPPKNN